MRRSAARRPKKALTKRSIFWLASAFLLTASVWYLLFVSRYIRKAGLPNRRGKEGSNVACLGWRQTRSCTPYGVRDFGGDKDCQEWISRRSGYCECEQHITVQRMHCGRYRAFTCENACNEVVTDPLGAEPLPKNLSCSVTGTRDNGLMGVAAGWLHQKSMGNSNHLSSHAKAVVKSLDTRAYALWSKIWKAAHIADSNFRLPESRTYTRDWVRDGVHIPRRDLLAIRSQWRTFMSSAPAYPADMFEGRGIVILAGGLTYLVPAWVNIQMLRRTGCDLPVEMFFPKDEFPTPALEGALARLGVSSRQLPNLGSPPQREGGDNEAEAQTSLSGFTLKIATLLLSRFREVIFLDSDNVPLVDPTRLFDTGEFLSTGALLWPDYWQSSAAPDLAVILDVQELPTNTFESGQMVFDKARAWDGLVLAAFFNLNSELYYELFSNYMGKGDKESFAHALQAVNRPFSVVKIPVGTVGEVVQQCHESGKCRATFLGNTMTQHSPDGKAMFLHTNLSPKWNLELPGDFSDYHRRWKVILPGETDFMDAYGDIEYDIYEMLAALRCASFLPTYLEALEAPEKTSGEASLGLQGFHPQNPGINFQEAYRWGLPGPYLQFVQVTTLDRLEFICNTVLKPYVRYIWRFILISSQEITKRRQYFVLRVL